MLLERDVHSYESEIGEHLETIATFLVEAGDLEDKASFQVLWGDRSVSVHWLTFIDGHRRVQARYDYFYRVSQHRLTLSTHTDPNVLDAVTEKVCTTYLLNEQGNNFKITELPKAGPQYPERLLSADYALIDCVMDDLSEALEYDGYNMHATSELLKSISE